MTFCILSTDWTSPAARKKPQTFCSVGVGHQDNFAFLGAWKRGVRQPANYNVSGEGLTSTMSNKETPRDSCRFTIPAFRCCFTEIKCWQLQPRLQIFWSPKKWKKICGCLWQLHTAIADQGELQITWNVHKSCHSICMWQLLKRPV